jgi:hypothetical protein
MRLGVSRGCCSCTVVRPAHRARRRESWTTCSLTWTSKRISRTSAWTSSPSRLRTRRCRPQPWAPSATSPPRPPCPSSCRRLQLRHRAPGVPDGPLTGHVRELGQGYRQVGETPTVERPSLRAFSPQLTWPRPRVVRVGGVSSRCQSCPPCWTVFHDQSHLHAGGMPGGCWAPHFVLSANQPSLACLIPSLAELVATLALITSDSWWALPVSTTGWELAYHHTVTHIIFVLNVVAVWC